VEDARQHHRLAGVERAAADAARDQELEVLGGRRVVAEPLGAHAERPQDQLRQRAQDAAERAEQDGEELERPGEPARNALGVPDRVDLRHELAERDVQDGEHRVADQHRDRRRRRVAEHVPERLLQQVRDRRLAHGADADRRERDPDLARRDVLVDPLDLLLGERRALRAVLRERLDAVDARADERVLRGHEERVHEDERRDAEQQDR
jgi:hypothetical protein